MGRTVSAALALVGLLVALDNLYEHPTYGNGLKAMWAALQAGEMFA